MIDGCTFPIGQRQFDRAMPSPPFMSRLFIYDAVKSGYPQGVCACGAIGSLRVEIDDYDVAHRCDTCKALVFAIFRLRWQRS